MHPGSGDIVPWDAEGTVVPCPACAMYIEAVEAAYASGRASMDAQYLALKAENERLREALLGIEKWLRIYTNTKDWMQNVADGIVKLTNDRPALTPTPPATPDKGGACADDRAHDGAPRYGTAPAEPAPKVCENCRWDDDVDEGYRCNGCGSAMEKWEVEPTRATKGGRG